MDAITAKRSPKQCVVCGTKFFYAGNKKTCSIKCSQEHHRQRTKRWLSDNLERNAKRHRQWLRQNKEKVRLSEREWRGKNREKLRAEQREKYHRNKTKFLAQQREYRIKKRGVRTRFCAVCATKFSVVGRPLKMTCSPVCSRTLQYKRSKEYQAAHRAEVLAFHRQYRQKNSGKLKEYKARVYYEGPSNPKGEIQWLRKNQAQLRNVKRLLRRLSPGLPPSPS